MKNFEWTVHSGDNSTSVNLTWSPDYSPTYRTNSTTRWNLPKRHKPPSAIKRDRQRRQQFWDDKSRNNARNTELLDSEAVPTHIGLVQESPSKVSTSCQTQNTLVTCSSYAQTEHLFTQHSQSQTDCCTAISKAAQTDALIICESTSQMNDVHNKSVALQTDTSDAAHVTIGVQTPDATNNETIRETSPPHAHQNSKPTSTNIRPREAVVVKPKILKSPMNKVLPEPELYWTYKDQQVLAIHNMERREGEIVHYVSLASGQRCWVPDEHMPDDEHMDGLPYIP
jgi:hypothetical protein